MKSLTRWTQQLMIGIVAFMIEEDITDKKFEKLIDQQVKKWLSFNLFRK